MFLIFVSLKTHGQDNLIKNPKLQTYDFSKYPSVSQMIQYHYYNWQTCKDWFCPNPYAAILYYYNIEIPVQYQIPNYVDSCVSIYYHNRRGEACPGCRDVSTELSCNRTCDESVMIPPILKDSYFETFTNVDDSLLSYVKSNNLRNYIDINPSIMYGTSRQYMSTELKQPLIVGQTYVFKFDIAYTAGRVSNLFGAAFTTYKPIQKTNERLNIKPQYQQTEGVESRFYQTVTYTFVADSAYRFLTLGCFLKNSEIIKKDYTKPLTYYKFISRVKVTNFSLVHTIIKPIIAGPRILCKPQVAKYYSKTNVNTQWYQLGDIAPIYIGDTFVTYIATTTTLVAQNNGFYDTFTVSVLPPFQKILKDTFFFTNNSYNAVYPNDVFKINWDNIAQDTFKHKTYYTSGYKFARVANYYNCTFDDSFYLKEINPAFKIIGDSLACLGNSSNIKHTLSDNRPIKWQINNNQLIASDVFLANDILGTHKIKACYDTMGYTFCDSLNLMVVEKPSSNLPKTLVFCSNAPQEVCPVISPTTSSFSWWDNSNIPCKTFNQQGTYTLALNNQGCLKTDTLITSVLPIPQFKVFQNDTPCLDGNHYTLLQIMPDTFKSYVWQPSGEMQSNLNINDTSSHTVTVTANNLCSHTISYKPMNNCKMFLFVPTAFSPNQNGTNDVFKIQGHYIQNLEMNIYNRWGEKIFETNDINQGWDGTYQGEMVQEGIYLIKIKITSMPQLNGQTPHAFYEMMLNVLR